MTLFRDRPADAIFLGGVVPALILCLVAVNLATGRVYVPTRYAGVAVYTDVWRAAGVIIFKTGVAAALFSWRLLANLKPVGRYAELCLTGSLVAVVVGIVLFIVGFVV